MCHGFLKDARILSIHIQVENPLSRQSYALYDQVLVQQYSGIYLVGQQLGGQEQLSETGGGHGESQPCRFHVYKIW